LGYLRQDLVRLGVRANAYSLLAHLGNLCPRERAIYARRYNRSRSLPRLFSKLSQVTIAMARLGAFQILNELRGFFHSRRWLSCPRKRYYLLLPEWSVFIDQSGAYEKGQWNSVLLGDRECHRVRVNPPIIKGKCQLQSTATGTWFGFPQVNRFVTA
jgi:hypothetical protein